MKTIQRNGTPVGFLSIRYLLEGSPVGDITFWNVLGVYIYQRHGVAMKVVRIC